MTSLRISLIRRRSCGWICTGPEPLNSPCSVRSSASTNWLFTGVTVHPAYWPVLPHWVSYAGRTVQVGWSTEEQDPHRLTLFSADGRRDVLVIPPETGADAAA
ncbi:DUF5994 family protein [Streptomyces sp. NPDC020298]|uniref:DUF5994 family protein n=1 Tax=unclassified Streptomyces TaxID=2593676 RepID=UPI0033F6FB18